MRIHAPTAIATAAVAGLLLNTATARDYGVSSRPAGRGTVYTDNRGGSAYVGPRGVAAQGANGGTAVATHRGAVYSNSGGTVATVNRNYGTAYAGRTAVVTTGAVVAPYPAGYITAVPPGAPTFVVSGYNCYFVRGVYYRPVFYSGTTIYVPVN